MPANLKSPSAEHAQDFLKSHAKDKSGKDALLYFAIHNAFAARLLQLRYQQDMTFVEIALEMKRSVDRIKHLHGAALERFFPYARDDSAGPLEFDRIKTDPPVYSEVSPERGNKYGK